MELNIHPVNQECRPIMDIEDKVPAVTKAIAIVRLVNKAGSRGASLIEISVGLGITKSHCYNILKGLTRAGWLLHDDARHTYVLSARMLSDISSIFSRRALSTVIHEELDKLSTAIRTPCLLTRLERDGSFVTIDRSDAAGELLFTAPIGFRFGPDAPAQMRVRLAFLDRSEREAELARWTPIAYTSTTIVDKNRLRAEVIATRARGYGISRAEYTPGVMTLAAPVFDAFGNVQMILQCPGLEAHVRAHESEIASELLAATARLNALLGNPPNGGKEDTD
jgi:DNA-binding IclR family transcriptional regulator